MKEERYAGKSFKGKKNKLDFPLHFAESEMHKHNLCPIALIPTNSFIFSSLFAAFSKWNERPLPFNLLSKKDQSYVTTSENIDCEGDEYIHRSDFYFIELYIW